MINKFHLDLFGLFIKFLNLPNSGTKTGKLRRNLFLLEEFYLCIGCLLTIKDRPCNYSLETYKDLSAYDLSNFSFLIKDYRFYIFFESFFKFGFAISFADRV